MTTPELMAALQNNTLTTDQRAELYTLMQSMVLEAGPARTATEQIPPFGSKRKAAMAVYTPPFKYDHGFIFDAENHMVADDGGISKSDPNVRHAIAARIRGWGRIGYLPNAAELQDEVGAMVADALNAYYAHQLVYEWVGALQEHIIALQTQNTELERLCESTYVAKGADAYNHACERMETYQDKRRAAGKEVGTVGSLCDGMEWVYWRLDELEAMISDPEVTYAHCAAPLSQRFRQYASAPLPVWAVDVRPVGPQDEEVAQPSVQPIVQSVHAVHAVRAVQPLPSFPTALRKMWSGGEVQDWINANVAPLMADAARYQMITADHDDRHLRIELRSICESLGVRSKGYSDKAIDDLIKEQAQ